MIFASRRSRKGPDPHLERKVVLFVVGAVLALAGMATESTWLVWLAIGVLALGVGLALLSNRGSVEEDETLEDGESPGGGEIHEEGEIHEGGGTHEEERPD